MCAGLHDTARKAHLSPEPFLSERVNVSVSPPLNSAGIYHARCYSHPGLHTQEQQHSSAHHRGFALCGFKDAQSGLHLDYSMAYSRIKQIIWKCTLFREV